MPGAKIDAVQIISQRLLTLPEAAHYLAARCGLVCARADVERTAFLHQIRCTLPDRRDLDELRGEQIIVFLKSGYST
jgi:hypothetical protein